MSKRVTLTDTELQMILKYIAFDLHMTTIAPSAKDIAVRSILVALKTKLGGDDE